MVRAGKVTDQPSTTVALALGDELDAAAAAVIEQGLKAYNMAEGGPSNGRPLAVTLLDQGTGRPLGGLRGRTSYGILYIDLLFVPDVLRSSGIGRRIVALAESEAVRRGCSVAMLFTHPFQAPAFYSRLGYEEFGRVEPDPPGRSRIYMQKRLTATARK